MSDEKIVGEFHHAVLHDIWTVVRTTDGSVMGMRVSREQAATCVTLLDDTARHFIQAERERAATTTRQTAGRLSDLADELAHVVENYDETDLRSSVRSVSDRLAALSNPTNGENA